MLTWTVCIIAAYFAGSIPFGVLIGHLKGVDIRAHGSKNVGATNVGRVLGRRLGLFCFALDVMKGAVPVLAAGFAADVVGQSARDLAPEEMWLWLAVAIAAVLGHMFSIFLRFGGGKGVATGFGAMAAMWPLLTIPAIGALVTWLAVLGALRIISLASMLGAIVVPLLYAALVIAPDPSHAMPNLAHGSPPLIMTALLAGLVIFRHRANIGRLRRGEEPKVGRKPARGTQLKQG
jgi:glycerol-3-phosphate acyltransferase PlsY